MQNILWEVGTRGKKEHQDEVSIYKENGNLNIGNIVARDIALLGK